MVDYNINSIAEKKLIQANDDLKYIKDRELELINVGGLVFVVQTGFQIDKEKVFTPELIGFEKITDKRALVNLAIDGVIEIKKVVLKKGRTRNNHIVKLYLKNLQDNKIEFIIEKGQVFENKEYEKESQNLVSARKRRFELGPNAEPEVPISFNAYCLNEYMRAPDGGLGNVTFYSLKNKIFWNGNQVWKIMRRMS